MFHRLAAVKPLEGYVLDATFENGERRKYDVNPLFKVWGVFNNLKNDGLFEKVRVDAGGYGVVWNDQIDLSAEDIYEFGKA